jgi:hypothetical protein
MTGPVVHLLNYPNNGHILHPAAHRAHDCWCEPAALWWVRQDDGAYVLVVEHNDFTAMHRRLQLAERAAGRPEHLAWIDKTLDTLKETKDAD